MKKLSIAWFSFSCCEDSTIVFTELLNDHFMEWRKILDIRVFPVLQRRENWDPIDVAFVEGAIADSKQEEKLKKLRIVATRLVAIGACACTGMPSMQRNSFSEEQKKAIQPIIERFAYGPTVRKVSDIVTVDAVVPGCPMDEKAFLAVLDKYVKEFGVG